MVDKFLWVGYQGQRRVFAPEQDYKLQQLFGTQRRLLPFEPTSVRNKSGDASPSWIQMSRRHLLREIGGACVPQ